MAATSKAQPYTNQARIRHLNLQTAAPLPKMKRFYHETLGLPVVEEKSDQLTIETGSSRITFRPAKETGSKPFYHFAFNIPENKIVAAREWQLKRSPLMPIPENLRDSRYPDDVVNYSHWNAHSIFFFDPAENVVEYIARHDLKNAAGGGFSAKDILCASEIAYVADDVEAAAKQIKETAGLAQYRGGSDQFMALGDEAGLLLIMKRGRMISFNATPSKHVTVFPTEVAISGPHAKEHLDPHFPYRLIVSPSLS